MHFMALIFKIGVSLTKYLYMLQYVNVSSKSFQVIDDGEDIEGVIEQTLKRCLSCPGSIY